MRTTVMMRIVDVIAQMEAEAYTVSMTMLPPHLRQTVEPEIADMLEHDGKPPNRSAVSYFSYLGWMLANGELRAERRPSSRARELLLQSGLINAV
jgi:hypothetical protein